MTFKLKKISTDPVLWSSTQLLDFMKKLEMDFDLEFICFNN